jgi:hypothetical protein
MKIFTVLILIFWSILLVSCEQKQPNDVFEPVDWKKREINIESREGLAFGSSYLSVYSEIYEMNEKTTHQLTATVSIRNTSLTDSVYITKADYFNTSGDLIRSYISSPVFLKPLETIEIIIHKKDTSGGTGANFVFDWAAPKQEHEPLFEAVMVWTTGHQGISFVTQGKTL